MVNLYVYGLEGLACRVLGFSGLGFSLGCWVLGFSSGVSFPQYKPDIAKSIHNLVLHRKHYISFMYRCPIW